MISFTDPLPLFFLLAGGHAVADFGLQSEWVATNKNRHVRAAMSPELRAQTQIIWPWLLGSHALQHGLLVALITQRPDLGLAEAVLHALTDFGKCERWYGFHADQVIHLATKALWVGLIAAGY